MSIKFAQIIAGAKPLPTAPMEQTLLLEYADANHVLGMLAHLLKEHDLSPKMRQVLKNGAVRSDYDHRMLQYEMNRLERAFMGSGLKPILLKGGSYVALGLEAGKGRRVSDLDILLPAEHMKEAEELLLAAGWQFDESATSEYDQNYYRENMHELPPFRHSQRRTIMDVHHRLLPPTARIKIKNDCFYDSVQLREGSILRVMSSYDRFIHSAIHAFADGSFDTPVRSLVELKLLLEDILVADHKDFLARINETEASLPCAYAFALIAKVFEIESAQKLSAELDSNCSSIVLNAFEDKLNGLGASKRSKALLYIRSHLLRMPLYKLLPHLIVKTFKWMRSRSVPVKLPEIQ